MGSQPLGLASLSSARDRGRGCRGPYRLSQFPKPRSRSFPPPPWGGRRKSLAFKKAVEIAAVKIEAALKLGNARACSTGPSPGLPTTGKVGPLEARAQLARERLVGAEHVGQVAVAGLQQDRLDAQVSEAGEVGEDLIGGALQRLAVGAEGVAAD